MFRRGGRRIPESEEAASSHPVAAPLGRVTSVLGPEVQFKGRITGRGGIRVEGSFEGEIDFDGLLVVAESGRVTCEEARARAIVVAGIFKGNLVAERVEIRKTGRVWGDVVTTSFATEEGAFLRGQIRMEEQLPAEEALPAKAEAPPEAKADAPEAKE
jgi:cytoskeletal protein CcmA (bactofilin family)